MLARLTRPLLSRPWSALYSSESAMRETEDLIRSTPSNPSSQCNVFFSLFSPVLTFSKAFRRAAPDTWKPFAENGVSASPFPSPHVLNISNR